MYNMLSTCFPFQFGHLLFHLGNCYGLTSSIARQNQQEYTSLFCSLSKRKALNFSLLSMIWAMDLLYTIFTVLYKT
jgi:hypothetical protein